MSADNGWRTGVRHRAAFSPRRLYEWTASERTQQVERAVGVQVLHIAGPQHHGDHPEDWKAPGAALVRSAATDRIPALADLGRVHIMGIASSEMSALARVLFDRGLPVSGCEAQESITVVGPRALGADVVISHSRHPWEVRPIRWAADRDTGSEP